MPTKNDRGHTARLIRFSNCRLLQNHQIICDDLWVRDGIILNPEKVFFDEQIRADVIVNCCGLLIAPGFIDVQINGTCICIMLIAAFSMFVETRPKEKNSQCTELLFPTSCEQIIRLFVLFHFSFFFVCTKFYILSNPSFFV